MVEGRMAPPSSFALKTPYWTGMLSDAAKVEPGFEQTMWSGRVATRKDFSAGQSAKNVTSINTVIGHMDSLDKAATALGNSDIPTYNKAVQAIAPQIGQAEYAGKLRTFQQAKEAVSNELMRVFRGTGASTGDTSKWAEQINAADSPTALKAVIKSGVDLLDSRIEALDAQYKRGMGTKANVMDLVNPKSKATLERLRGTAPTAPAGAGGAAQPLFATNPQTKQRIMSEDGGQTWKPAQ